MLFNITERNAQASYCITRWVWFVTSKS